MNFFIAKCSCLRGVENEFSIKIVSKSINHIPTALRLGMTSPSTTNQRKVRQRRTRTWMFSLLLVILLLMGVFSISGFIINPNNFCFLASITFPITPLPGQLLQMLLQCIFATQVSHF